MGLPHLWKPHIISYIQIYIHIYIYVMSFDPSPTDGTEIVAPATCGPKVVQAICVLLLCAQRVTESCVPLDVRLPR